MSNKNAGISLIEIMVVVAIVGILTSIAIPTYSNHVLKAKATELLTTANAYKLEAMEQEINDPQAQLDKNFPSTSPNIETINLSTKGDAASKHYVIDIKSKITTPQGNLSLKLLGRPADGMISWECKVPAAIANYMPKSCQA